MQILAFGDSIVEGFYDAKGGWVERLRDFTNRKSLSDEDFWCLVRNLGVSGDTSENLLDRFSSETKVRTQEGEETVIIFGVGTNDCAYFRKVGNPKITESEFRRNAKMLISEARRFTENIIFMEITPVDESKVCKTPWLGAFGIAWFYSNDRIGKYNEILRDVCAKENALFIPQALGDSNYKKYLFDGLHPNSEGHRLIFEKVKGFLLENDLLK